MKTHKLLLTATVLSMSGMLACSHMGSKSLSERFFKTKDELAHKGDRKVAEDASQKSEDIGDLNFSKSYRFIQYGSTGKPVVVYKGVKDASAVVRVQKDVNVTCTGPNMKDDAPYINFEVEDDGEVRCQNTAPAGVVNKLDGKTFADIKLKVEYSIKLKAWDWEGLKAVQFDALSNAKKSILEGKFDDGMVDYLGHFDTIVTKIQTKIPANKAERTVIPVDFSKGGDRGQLIVIDSAEGSVAMTKNDLLKAPIPVGGMDDKAIAKKFGARFKGAGLMAPGERAFALVCSERVLSRANNKQKFNIVAREGNRLTSVYRDTYNSAEMKMDVGCYVNGVKARMRSNVGEFLVTVYTFGIPDALVKIQGIIDNEKALKDSEDKAKNISIVKGIKDNLKVSADENKDTVYEYEKQYAIDKAAYEAAEKARIAAEEKAAAEAKKAKEEAEKKLAEEKNANDSKQRDLEEENKKLAEQNARIRGDKAEEKKRTVEEMEVDANNYIAPVLYDEFYMLLAKFTLTARQSVTHKSGEGEYTDNARVYLHFENEGYLYTATNGEFDEERASLFTPYKYVPTKTLAAQIPNMFNGKGKSYFDRIVCAADLDKVKQKVRKWNVNVQNHIDAPTVNEVLSDLNAGTALSMNDCKLNKATPMYKLPTFKREMKYRFCYRREAYDRWTGVDHVPSIKLVPDRIEASYVWRRKGKAPKREVVLIKGDAAKNKTVIYLRQKSLVPEKERISGGKESVDVHPFFSREILTHMPVNYLGEGGCADSDFFYPSYESDGAVTGFRHNKIEE